MQPAVVISAYNRPKAFARLLASLRQAQYPPGSPVRMIISIDRAEKNDQRDVLELAEGFRWDYGEKQVIFHEEHLGVVEHFYRCGSLAQAYESIILLEDDPYVSPMYYLYTAQALEYFKDEPRIAGISLYTLWFNGYTHLPFIPLPDDSDIFFLQIPYTQGQAFTGCQWASFQDWLDQSDRRLNPADPLHEMFLRFEADEWFPIRTKYLVETGRWYVFPRSSLTTGFGDPGAHFNKTSSFFQVPLQTAQKEYRFKPLDSSNALYDSFFEITPDRIKRLNPSLSAYSFDVDLNGTKDPTRLKEDLVLTSQPRRNPGRVGGSMGSAPLRTFGKVMWPLEANVIYEIPGEGINFCRKESVKTGRLARLTVKKSNYEYYSRYQPVGKKLLLQFLFFDLLKKFGWR